MITKVQSWIYVLAAIGAFAFWAVTMYGIPPRVTRLEEQMREYEHAFAKDDIDAGVYDVAVPAVQLQADGEEAE